MRKNRLATTARIERDPDVVPNTRPLERTCALYKPPNAARVQIVASAVITVGNQSQNKHAADFFEDFFLDAVNIVKSGRKKRMLVYAE